MTKIFNIFNQKKDFKKNDIISFFFKKKKLYLWIREKYNYYLTDEKGNIYFSEMAEHIYVTSEDNLVIFDMKDFIVYYKDFKKKICINENIDWSYINIFKNSLVGIEKETNIIYKIEHSKITFITKLNINYPLSISYFFVIADDKFMLLDELNHMILIFNKYGEVINTYGVFKEPGSTNNKLNSPQYIKVMNDLLFVCDSMNNRILILDQSLKFINKIENKKDYLYEYVKLLYPTYCYMYKDILMINSQGKHNIVSYHQKQNIYRTNMSSTSKLLSYPRIFSFDKHYWYISDTVNNRVLTINKATNEIKNLYNSITFYWPRSIESSENFLIISNSLKKELVLINKLSGKIDILKEYYYGQQKFLFHDVHHSIIYRKDNIVFADSDCNKVCCINFKGELQWEYLYPNVLNDPHYLKIYKNNLLIVNTGNNEIIIFNIKTKNTSIFNFFVFKNRKIKVDKIRCIEIYKNYIILYSHIISGIVFLNFNFICIKYIPIKDFHLKEILYNTRCFKLYDSNLFISDYNNGDIIKLHIGGLLDE